jgi:hypothetical protein
MTEDLRVTVGSEPEPGFLRPAIEAALAGRPWPPGPEAQIAAAVAANVGDRHPPGMRTTAPAAEGGRGR